MTINIYICVPVDAGVRGGDGRRELGHVPVLQDPDPARPHRGAQALRPDHTRGGAHADG